MSALGATCHADGRPPLVALPKPALCSGRGCHHSPTAKQDPRPLQTITMPEVYAMLNDPACLEKHDAPWFIPSTLLSRTFEEQREQGVFYCLWAETDEPSGTLRDMSARVADAVGCELWVYTTRSATTDRQKTRFLLPLAESVPGHVFVMMQKVFNFHLQACGIPPDPANQRAGQLCYLPNRGAFYDWVHVPHERLDPAAWRGPVAAIQKRKQDEEEEAQRQREISRLKARERVSRGQASPIDAMNAEYRLPDVLLQYGYCRRRNRWLSPLSESGRAGVMITKDGRKWISVHASDAAAGLGMECTNGRMGDVFDLFTHFEHGGDRTAALKAAARLFELPDAGGRKAGKPNQKVSTPSIGDPYEWTKDFVVSEEEIRNLKRPEWIIPNLVIRGHMVIVVAEPNAGKTTIFAHLAGEMADLGYRVFYVNADISGSDAAEFLEASKKRGWTALLPDLKPGRSMQHVIDHLAEMNEKGGDLSNVVFIFDTLKKMTDVINKKSVKNLLRLMRALTGKGMTIIPLGHTNKYGVADGKPIFEGTGDVRADCDELIYLIPKRHEDKSMTVSTLPDKKRGDFEPITFNISAERVVTRASEHVDTEALRLEEIQWAKDETVIQAITDALKAGRVKQTEIVEFCRSAAGIGRRSVEAVLNRYASGPRQQWTRQRGMQKNSIRYHRV